MAQRSWDFRLTGTKELRGQDVGHRDLDDTEALPSETS